MLTPLYSYAAPLALTALATALPDAARAQTVLAPPPAASAASTPSATLAPVTVTGRNDRETATSPTAGYRAKSAATASKTDTPLRETPQSVTVVTRDQFVDQGATNLQDALNYAAGIRSDAYGLDSRTDSVRIRGGYPDEYLDGLRKNFEYYTSNARTEPFTLERIDVLRGPSAMLYGQGSTGGVVNMVSKRPQAEAQGEIGVQLGSWNRRQVQADLTGPLSPDGQWLYRLVAVARKADTQVDDVRDDRTVFAPSLTWRPNAATSWTFQALYQKDKTGSTSQFFPWSGTLSANPNGTLPTRRFVGEPGWDRYDTERSFVGWLFEHKFDERWTVRQNLRYTSTDVDYRTLYGDSFTLPGDWAGDPVNKRLFGRFADAAITKTQLLTADQHLQGTLEAGGIRHTLLAGLDYAHYRKSGQSAFDAPVYLGGTVALIDAYAPVYGNFTPPAFSDILGFTQRQLGLYVQDQMKLGANWIVMLGLRHDRARNETEGADAQTSSATTKRAGLMYAFEAGWSPYLSYSESFTPVANQGNQRFEPLRGKQWELGVKYEPRDGELSFNAAAYDLREANQLTQTAEDIANNRYSQLGETHALGVELELKTTLARSVDVIANYTYTNVDEQIEAVPQHQASVWGKWRFALAGRTGFALGAGVRHLSAFH
ncbi:MAG TPA: TonB-dependent siderophore receptor, partial [Burkholderiaceae bacterium]|nr:TonB-dependent siderophore receptor [Burkholderiaceae bacterium]